MRSSSVLTGGLRFRENGFCTMASCRTKVVRLSDVSASKVQSRLGLKTLSLWNPFQGTPEN